MTVLLNLFLGSKRILLLRVSDNDAGVVTERDDQVALGVDLLSFWLFIAHPSNL